jgi:hypothetical protein
MRATGRHRIARGRWASPAHDAGSRIRSLFFGSLAAIALLVVLPQPLLADGGTLRLANVPMGLYRVNVFTAPTPIAPDSVDVSVLVTYERGRRVASDLQIEVVARSLDLPGTVVRHEATKDQAEDPRYYAAKFALGEVGDWEMEIRLEGPEGEGTTRFTVSVREPGLLDNPWIVLFAALTPLVLVGWWLRRSGPSGSEPGPASVRDP